VIWPRRGAGEPEAFQTTASGRALIRHFEVIRADGLLVMLPPLLSLVTTAAVRGLGGSHVIDGLMSVGALVAFQALLTQFNRPFGDLVGLGSSVQTLQAELARLDDVEQHRTDPVFDSAPLAPGLTGRGPPQRLSGRLEFRDVTFGFNRTLDEPLIKRFSLTIRPGSRVALVGLSGSGKSTIGRLTAGLLRLWEGEILYDGFSIDEIPRAVFTDQVGLVDDHTLLFSGTIRENLTLWDDAVADREVSRVAMDAGIHRDVVRLRHGCSARLSEGARNLSGGQRQRMEIGRALVRSPALLILDDATSALDPVTEALVDDNLRRRGCTCLIIAHRLSTIRDCEEIIVLQQGKVIERGTHDEQMTDAGGFYAQLQALQDGACASRCAAPGRSEQQIAVPISASINATLPEGVPYANGHTDQSAVLKGISDSIARAHLPAVATAVATIEAQRPADLDEALARIGDVVVAGRHPDAWPSRGRRPAGCADS
jgi:ABC-type bacteriocin/lantibiotic exporter with double-glycine peptidase domain